MRFVEHKSPKIHKEGAIDLLWGSMSSILGVEPDCMCACWLILGWYKLS